MVKNWKPSLLNLLLITWLKRHMTSNNHCLKISNKEFAPLQAKEVNNSIDHLYHTRSLLGNKFINDAYWKNRIGCTYYDTSIEI